MSADVLSDVDRMLIALRRLRTSVDAVANGAIDTRDDLAVALHLLLGEGEGYGLLSRVWERLGIAEPIVGGWSSDEITREFPPIEDGFGPSETIRLPTTLAVRATPTLEESTSVPLSSLVNQECLYFAVPGFEPHGAWTWAALLRKLRNKFGGHVDAKPPRWLDELRFYPAADQDAVAYLLWRLGTVVLRSVTRRLDEVGLDVERYEVDQSYSGGMRLDEFCVLQSGTKLDVRAHLECDRWDVGYRRLVVGARHGDRPFILGLEGDARLSLSVGDPGSSLRDLEFEFRSKQPNAAPRRGSREQRRAAARRRRRP
jgi:hypothetical protein